MPLLHVACSGAKVGDLFTKQAVEGPNITAQLDSAYASGTPELITITAGANDAHWDEFIRGCYAANCSNRATTLLANGYLVSLRTKLHVALTAIAERSNNKPPQVILTGYYNPLSATCTQYQSNITASEIAWLTSETDALNKTIQNVVKKYPFASFAPVDFTGHDICSGDSWVQGLTDPAPFHPTAQGQQAIAQSVLRAVN
jgi:lysophospholipase L1-like esterase